MIQARLKGSAKTRLFRSPRITVRKKEYIIRKLCRLWKINGESRPNLGVELHGKD